MFQQTTSWAFCLQIVQFLSRFFRKHLLCRTCLPFSLRTTLQHLIHFRFSISLCTRLLHTSLSSPSTAFLTVGLSAVHVLGITFTLNYCGSFRIFVDLQNDLYVFSSEHSSSWLSSSVIFSLSSIIPSIATFLFTFLSKYTAASSSSLCWEFSFFWLCLLLGVVFYSLLLLADHLYQKKLVQWWLHFYIVTNERDTSRLQLCSNLPCCTYLVIWFDDYPDGNARWQCNQKFLIRKNFRVVLRIVFIKTQRPALQFLSYHADRPRAESLSPEFGYMSAVLNHVSLLIQVYYVLLSASLFYWRGVRWGWYEAWNNTLKVSSHFEKLWPLVRMNSTNLHASTSFYPLQITSKLSFYIVSVL